MSKFATFVEKERRFSNSGIRYHDLKIWTYLRIYVFDIFLKNQSSQQKPDAITIKRVLVNLFWGFPTKLAYKSIVFSSSDQRKYINGKWMDRLDSIDTIRNAALFVELPNPNHYQKGEISSTHVLSKGWFYLFEKLISLFIFNINVSQKDELIKFLDELNVEVNVEHLLKNFRAQYLFSTWFFKFFRTENLFLTTHYTNMGRIYAAKRLGIKVIELQHGLITRYHNAYHLVEEHEIALLPDSIFVFGQRDKEILVGSKFLPEEQISVVGSAYLDYLISQKLAKYSNTLLTFCFTAQDIELSAVVFYLNTLQENYKEGEFLFIPRRLSIQEYYERGLNKRWVTSKDDTYVTMAKSSIHLSMYSTCALESIRLGTPTVLLNISGHARIHFSQEIDNLFSLHCLNSLNELKVFDFKSFYSNSQGSQVSEGDWLYKPSYETNLKKVLMKSK